MFLPEAQNIEISPLYFMGRGGLDHDLNLSKILATALPIMT